jgi:hypothetical protein
VKPYFYAAHRNVALYFQGHVILARLNALRNRSVSQVKRAFLQKISSKTLRHSVAKYQVAEEVHGGQRRVSAPRFCYCME